MFGDSIKENLGIITELLQGVPPSERDKAKRAAVKIEKAVMDIQKDSYRQPAVGLGMAFALFKIAERIVEGTNSGDSEKSSGLIQLLS